MYSTREIATLIWVALFVVWMLFVPSVRKSVVQLFTTFFNSYILASVSVMGAYTAICCVLLSYLDLWHGGMLKDTLVWFFFTGFFLVSEFIPPKDEGPVFKKVFFDNVKAILLVEFILNTYTMSLTAELIFVPFVTFIVAINAVAKLNDEHKPVEKFTGYMISITGFLIFGYSVWEAINGWGQLDKWDAFRSIVYPPLMSMLFFPLVYLMSVLSAYETSLLGLKLGPEKTKALKRYVWWKSYSRCGLRIKNIRQLKDKGYFGMMQVQSKSEVDSLLDDIFSDDTNSPSQEQ